MKEIGVAVIDRFTYYMLEYMEKVEYNSKNTILQFVKNVDETEKKKLVLFSF